MTTTRPERAFERLLLALERDLLEAPDEEILTVAGELGMKPAMRGSIALLGVTYAFRLKDPRKKSRQQSKEARSRSDEIRRPRRRPKGDAPST